MATDILTTLEFDRIRAMLRSHCQFSLAAERAEEIGPSSDSAHVRYLLSVTAEAFDLLESFPSFGVRGARDIRTQLERAAIGGVLQPTELLEVLNTLASARTSRRAFLRIDDAAQRFPAFDEFIGFISELPSLEAELQRSIGERGDVLDSASDQLRTIRQQMRVAHNRVVERINRFITGGQHTTAIQDPIVTMRDGRYVVPVRVDRRGLLPGVVHDTSASGQTIFVEPMEVVELNNRWRELQAAERHEIERILTMLSGKIGAEAERISRSLDALAAIDLALAKARLAASMRATPPVLVDRSSKHGRRIALRRARHPLIDPAVVVPIDLELGTAFRVLVITGPNTGGKTVALKTIGLLSLMTQAGLFIPADEGSEMCVFDGVFADIGDEQSIQQNLSTFSSHMARVIAMLRSVTADSLVLLDELGAGTDPEEGAALARAIVTELLQIGCLAIGTTHYSELKAFAYATEGAENGSVEFDVATLSPTYRLVVGVPGRSNALAIAQRIGMPTHIIERAREHLNPDVERVDTLLAEIKRRRANAEELERQAQSARDEARAARDEANRARETARLEREMARQDALAEVELELAEARAALRRVRELPARTDIERSPQTIRDSRRVIEEAAQQVREVARRHEPPIVPNRAFRVGDTVEVPALGGVGDILSISDDGLDAEIQLGLFKIRQPLAALRPASQPASQARSVQPIVLPPPRRHVDTELHLRGQRAAGVDQLVDDYLNDAYLQRLPYVRIVHGKGTGALREVVRGVVAKHPLVERFETPPQNEGGDGVTVVYLRET